MSNPKQTAPGTAEYKLDGKVYMLHRTYSHYHKRWDPWRAYLGHSYSGGTAEELDALAELMAFVAGVCREMDSQNER